MDKTIKFSEELEKVTKRFAIAIFIDGESFREQTDSPEDFTSLLQLANLTFPDRIKNKIHEA